MKNIISITFCLFFVVSAAFAQDSERRKHQAAELKGIVYDKEFSVDIRPMTNGFALAGNYGLIKTYYKTRVLQFELLELRHPREVRQSFDLINTPLGNTPKAFVYGKQNSFFAFHFGYGGKRYFSQKADRKGVSVGMSYAIGPSLGFIKPYYLQLRKFEQLVPEKYSEENASLFLNEASIFGGAGFSFGLDELSVVPGGQAKVGLHLDWGAFDEYVKAIEAGLMLDVYPKAIPLMVIDDNPSFFLNFYVNVQIGKRW